MWESSIALCKSRKLLSRYQIPWSSFFLLNIRLIMWKSSIAWVSSYEVKSSIFKPWVYSPDLHNLVLLSQLIMTKSLCSGVKAKLICGLELYFFISKSFLYMYMWIKQFNYFQVCSKDCIYNFRQLSAGTITRGFGFFLMIKLSGYSQR